MNNKYSLVSIVDYMKVTFVLLYSDADEINIIDVTYRKIFKTDYIKVDFIKVKGSNIINDDVNIRFMNLNKFIKNRRNNIIGKLIE